MRPDTGDPAVVAAQKAGAMAEPGSRVGIVLVNWNGLEDTLACLDSLAGVEYADRFVVVVDNGSRGDEAGAIEQAHPEVAVLRSGRNLGFTGGNNLGIRHALEHGADHILCLNNDTVVAPDFLAHLVAALEADPTIGMTVAKIFYYDEPDKPWYLGAECTFDDVALQRGWVAWHPPYPERASLIEPFDTQIATGCALLIRGEALRLLAGPQGDWFDQRYFAYYEDVDLSLRADKLGFRRVVVPRARVWHKVSRSSGGASSSSVWYYCIRNAKLLALAHAPEGRQVGAKFFDALAHKIVKEACATARAQKRYAHPIFRAQAQAGMSGVWCARLEQYERRHDHPWVERAAAARLAWETLLWRKARWRAVLGRQLMRPYWYLHARVLRGLRRS